MGIEDDEMSAGFSSAQVKTEPTERPEPVAKAEREPEQQAKTQSPPADPLNEVIARLDKIDKSHNTLAGHVGGLKRDYATISEKLAAANAATRQVSDAPTQNEIKQAMDDPGEWKELKGLYPEWATATEKFLDAKLASQQKIDPDAMEKKFSDMVRGQSAEFKQDVYHSLLETQFPNWDDDVKSEAFKAWYSAQPDEVKALDSSETNESLKNSMKLLRLYEAHKTASAAPKPKASDRQKVLAAAVQTRGSGGHPPGPNEEDEFEAGFRSTQR